MSEITNGHAHPEEEDGHTAFDPSVVFTPTEENQPQADSEKSTSIDASAQPDPETTESPPTSPEPQEPRQDVSGGYQKYLENEGSWENVGEGNNSLNPEPLGPDTRRYSWNINSGSGADLGASEHKQSESQSRRFSWTEIENPNAASQALKEIPVNSFSSQSSATPTPAKKPTHAPQPSKTRPKPTNINPHSTTLKPSWPFANETGQRVQLQGLKSPAAPRTPSEINPIYGLPVGVTGNQAEKRGGGYGDLPYGNSNVRVVDDDEKMRGFKFGGSPPIEESYDHQRHYHKPSAGTNSLSKSKGLFGLGIGVDSSSRALTSNNAPSVFDSPVFWIVAYFFFNLSLSIFNKHVTNKFKFPWTITAIHTLFGTLGCRVARGLGFYKESQDLGTREHLTLIAFSILYTVNIGISTLSLGLISLAFHSIIRSTTPLATIMLSTVMLRKRYPRKTWISLLPVVAGVALCGYGTIEFTFYSFLVTLLGVFLAALKTVVTNMVMVGRLKLGPLDVLGRMSPLAFIQCVFWSWWTGELERVREFGATKMDFNWFTWLCINGIIAFGLNVVSFTANKKTSALTMTVSANVKQVLSIVLGIIIFSDPLNFLKVSGILLTLFGGAWYAQIEFLEKEKKKLMNQSRN